LFVRHAAVELDLDSPASTWRLSEEGRIAAAELATRLAPVRRVLTSPEPKAIDTAVPLAEASGVPLELDDRLREVGRAVNVADYDEHRGAVRAYLSGDPVEGWEDAAAARARFAAALEKVDDAAVVTHGTVLALFLGYDFPRWEQIALPDVIEWQP
jgi:broad specificity phosphatase PhoE